MSARIPTSLLAAALTLTAGAAHATCPSRPGDTTGIQHAVQGLYDALARDDADGVQAVVTSDFYAYDVGRHFTSAAELAAAVTKAHRAGATLEWHLRAIKTHVDCDMALATWKNHGQVGSGKDVKPMTWLESAVLRRVGSRWRIRFLHSTRVPPAP